MRKQQDIMNTRLAILVVVVLTSPLLAAAFSAISMPTPPSYPRVDGGKSRESGSSSLTHGPAPAVAAVEESIPWRIVLDLGREPLATGLPFDWGRSGCRLPMKIPCHFTMRRQSSTDNTDSSSGTTTTTNLVVTPISDTVSFTGPEGAVVRPVEGGEWSFVEQKQQLTFALVFPESMARRDVSLAPGTMLQCTGTAYTQSELDRRNDEFYRARDAVWDVGQELNERSRRTEAPKKWNEQTQQWEQRYSPENPLSWMKQRVSYWSAKARQDQTNRQRPSANDLSSVGRLPGIEDPVYIAKGGIVRAASNGAVLGKWYAEPIVAGR